VNIDDFIDAELSSISVYPISARRASKLDDIYFFRSQIIAEWLATLRKPIGIEYITGKEWHAFKKEATRFRVIDGHLFHNNTKNVPFRRVIDSPEQQQEIFKILHDKSGHRGIEGTYRKIADRYWWDAISRDIKAYIKTCDPCQYRESKRTKKALFTTSSNVF
jgi:hypothetical protein